MKGHYGKKYATKVKLVKEYLDAAEEKYEKKVKDYPEKVIDNIIGGK